MDHGSCYSSLSLNEHILAKIRSISARIGTWIKPMNKHVRTDTNDLRRYVCIGIPWSRWITRRYRAITPSD